MNEYSLAFYILIGMAWLLITSVVECNCLGYRLNLDTYHDVIAFHYPNINMWCKDNNVNLCGRILLYILSTIVMLPGMLMVFLVHTELFIIYQSICLLGELFKLLFTTKEN